MLKKENQGFRKDVSYSELVKVMDRIEETSGRVYLRVNLLEIVKEREEDEHRVYKFDSLSEKEKRKHFCMDCDKTVILFKGVESQEYF